MDLEVARKSLSPEQKQGGFSSKKFAFLAVAGVILVAGIAWRASSYLGEKPAEEKAPVAVEAAPQPEAAPPPAVGSAQPKTPAPAPDTAAAPPSEPSAPATAQQPKPAAPSDETAQQPEPEGEAVGQSEQQEDLPGTGMILVSRKPVEVLSSPSADAPAMFGFPAGRPFRVIGREGGFAHIKDLRSGASGWIDEAALTAPPPRAPAVAAPSPSKSRGSSGGANPKATAKKNAPTTAASEPTAETGSVQTQRRPGLFGKGGLFGGIFGGGN